MMGYGRGFYWPNHMYGAEGYFPYGGLIMMGVVVVILIVGIMLIRKGRKKLPSSNALESLKLRYVKGEIDEETYLRMKKTLE